MAPRIALVLGASNFRHAVADNLGMSFPRAIVPGRRYMITRRCSERRFFMRPERRHGPVGRMQRIFEDVSRLPRRQQDKVIEFVEAFVAQQRKAG
jgi:hypothetical protein